MIKDALLVRLEAKLDRASEFGLGYKPLRRWLRPHEELRRSLQPQIVSRAQTAGQ
jgi:hypothetical protein